MAAAPVYSGTVDDKRVTGGLLSTREKAKELWEWLHNLEAMKYDHCEQLKRQRYEVSDERATPCSSQCTGGVCSCPHHLLFALFQVVSLRNRIDELQKQ